MDARISIPVEGLGGHQMLREWSSFLPPSFEHLLMFRDVRYFSLFPPSAQSLHAIALIFGFESLDCLQGDGKLELIAELSAFSAHLNVSTSFGIPADST